MTSMSCCSVDNCFFMPLWSRRKFCFCGAAAASQSQPRRTGGGRRRGLTIRFMTATKHQNVLGSSEPMAT